MKILPQDDLYLECLCALMGRAAPPMPVDVVVDRVRDGLYCKEVGELACNVELQYLSRRNSGRLVRTIAGSHAGPARKAIALSILARRLGVARRPVFTI
jgi:hypothetical protein